MLLKRSAAWNSLVLCVPQLGIFKVNYKACVSGESTKWGGKKPLVFKCTSLITRRKGIICAADLENGSKCLGSPRASALSRVFAPLPGCRKNDDLGVEDGGQRFCCSSVSSYAAAATRIGARPGLQHPPFLPQ